MNILGLDFNNPIGLAAGFDKNGDYIDALGKLGFGFIEVGTVTPKPQSGNPTPRIFRFPSEKALINRMGFNNKGVDYLIERLKRRKYKGIVGVNVGKNATTPIENAIDDYLICLKKVYTYADYITINISSPNTQQLRQLQEKNHIHEFLFALSTARNSLVQETKKHKPLLLKISPDETNETLEAIVDAVIVNKIEGIIATNTSIDKTPIQHLPHSNETGGLSGHPIFCQATQTLKYLNQLIQEKKSSTVLIGVGGITDKKTMQEKFTSGAQLIQLYTGLIYDGPFFIKKLLKNSQPP
jgi:dihydroorotate dehydrogenase